MTETEIFFCNRTYSEGWFEDIQASNPQQRAVIDAIVEAIELSDGGDIDRQEIYQRHPKVAQYVAKLGYKIVPTNGQQLAHNGLGVRHAKYSPSKSVAVLWEKIRGTIYITFDDHAPVRYHRAIHSLSELRLGRRRPSLKSRNSRKFTKLMKKKHNRKMKGVDLRKRNYI